MTVSIVLWIILTVAAVAVAVFTVLVLWQLFGILGRVKEEVTPILRKVEKTIDEINQDLARVDDIIKTGEQVVDKVNTTTKIAQEAISSPLIKLVSMGAGVKRAYDSLRRKK